MDKGHINKHGDKHMTKLLTNATHPIRDPLHSSCSKVATPKLEPLPKKVEPPKDRKKLWETDYDDGTPKRAFKKKGEGSATKVVKKAYEKVRFGTGERVNGTGERVKRTKRVRSSY